MNHQRRKDIDKIKDRLESLSSELEDILSDIENVKYEEQEYFDNMPESLQGGDKGTIAEEAVSALEEALQAVEDFDIDSIVSSLQDAQG